MEAKVLAVANQKGGVGKTTTALSLGAALGRGGKKVLVMDLDPHCCASVHLGYFPERVERSVYDVFLAENAEEASLKRAIARGEGANFDFVPSQVKLSDLDADLAARENKGLILTRAFEAIRADYDYLIIDCPPQMGVLLVNALVASDLLIIPIQTDFLALHGLRLIFDTLRVLGKVMRRPLRFSALATMHDKRIGACRRVLKMLRDKLGQRMFETVIHLDTQFREASAAGKVIYDVAPASRGGREYMNLADEIAKIL